MGLFTGQVRYAADFKESEHPRDHGKFATKEGGESSSSTATAEKPKQSGPKPILEEGSAVAKRARQNARAMLGKMKKGEIDAKDAKADNDIRRDKALADNRNNFAKRWRDLEGRVESAYPPEAMDSDEWLAVKDSFRAAKDKVAGLIEKGSELVDAEIYWYAKGENKNVGKGTVEELDDLHNDIVSAYETGVNGIADALEAFFAKNGRKAYVADGWPVRYGQSLFTGRVVRYSSMFEGVVRYAQRGLFDEEDHERGPDGKFVEKGGDDLPSWQTSLWGGPGAKSVAVQRKMFDDTPLPVEEKPHEDAEGQGTFDFESKEQTGDARNFGRSRKNPVMHFETPVVGPSGAKLDAYEWKHYLEEDVDEKGEERIRKRSDWEAAAQSGDTGRDVVHHFHVTTPDGKGHVVSLESALKMMGYTKGDSSEGLKKVKSLSSTLKNRAKSQLELEMMKDAVSHAEEKVKAAEEKAQKMPLPELEKEKSNERLTKYRMGDAEVWAHHSPDGPTKETDDERIALLKTQWRGHRVNELVSKEDMKPMKDVFGFDVPPNMFRSSTAHRLIKSKEEAIAKLDKKIKAATEQAADAAEKNSALFSGVVRYSIFDGVTRYEGSNGRQRGDQSPATNHLGVRLLLPSDRHGSRTGTGTAQSADAGSDANSQGDTRSTGSSLASTERGVNRYDAGQWVTMGGKKSPDKDGKKGGSPVYIEDGKITKGAPSLVGKKPGDMKAEADIGTHRQQLNQGKGYERAVWAKKARQAGIKPEHLHGLANEYMEKSKRFVADRKELLTEARRTSKGLGYGDLRTVAARVSRTGMDEDSVKGLDDIAQLLGDKYKDHFGEEEPLRRLFEMLVEGDPKPISEDEAYEKAFDELEYAKGQEQPAQSDPDDVVPFQCAGTPIRYSLFTGVAR